MKPLLRPSEWEVLKLGPPAAGDIRIRVDPQRAGSPFTAGMEILLPGAEIPVHRHLGQEEVLFVHKGQGRAVLEDQTVTVVPGMMLYIRKQAWHGLRNTGTGNLQVAWISAPPGIEQFFRALSQLGAQASPAAIQELATRYGIEFRTEHTVGSAGSSPVMRRRRRHRGGRGRRRSAGQQGALGSSPPALPKEPRQGSQKATGTVVAPAPASPHAPKATPKLPRESQRRGPRRHMGHVKEVYMGGRWVRISGEGPVISPGSGEVPGDRQKGKPGDATAGPFSVPL